LNLREQDDIRKIARALYVKRNRFGKLDGDNRSGRGIREVITSGRYKIPHGGADVVDQAMMLLQAMIGDEPTSINDAEAQPDGTLQPRKAKPDAKER
jgi:hypothetical protein